ncbi:hypothetical protein D3C71_855620 [compost metagenome]
MRLANACDEVRSIVRPAQRVTDHQRLAVITSATERVEQNHLLPNIHLKQTCVGHASFSMMILASATKCLHSPGANIGFVKFGGSPFE